MTRDTVVIVCANGSKHITGASSVEERNKKIKGRKEKREEKRVKHCGYGTAIADSI